MSQDTPILSREQRADLRKKLEQHFNKDELRTLCSDLGVQYENLPDTLEGMARELVAHCERDGTMPELLNGCRQQRPKVTWPQLPTWPPHTPPPIVPAHARGLGAGMIVLVIVDVVLALVLAWRSFGDEPNVLAYIQAMTGVLALVLQIVGVFIALRVRHLALQDMPVEIGKRKWVWGVITGMTVVLAIFLFMPLLIPVVPSLVPTSAALAVASPTAAHTSSPVPIQSVKSTPTPIPITILSPVQGGVASFKTRIRGTARSIPADRQLWLVVQSYMNDGYYPQSGPIKVDSNGNWETVAFVGTNKMIESTKPFTITAVLADQAASQQFASFVQTWPVTRSLVLLPAGVQVYASVRVTRNNPVVELHTPLANAQVQGYEEMKGAYEHLEPGIWRLYGIVEGDQGSFTPYGPFDPQAEKGEWSIPVNFPWPSDGSRSVTFYAMAALSGTRADDILGGAAKDQVSLAPKDLSERERPDIYEPVAKTTFTRAERIAFASDRQGNDDVFVVNSDGSGLKRLTDHPAFDGDPAWSPDGKQIAFASERDGPIQLYMMDAAGQNVHRIITPTVVPGRMPNWSPDGQWIAFHSEQNGNTDIYKVRVDGTDLTQLTQASGENYYPVWSPDGKRILFQSWRDQDAGGLSELYVMDADGRNVARLTHNMAREGYAVWSPDGRRILFIGELEGNRDVYTMDADGSHVTRQPSEDYDNHPSFAPDGQRYVYQSTVKRVQLFVAKVGGSRSTQIETGLAMNLSPAWSPVPGDERIAFVGRYRGDWEIYTMWDDGTEVKRMMDAPSNEIQPRLSPDGRWLVFASDVNGEYKLWREDAHDLSPWTQLTKGPGRDIDAAWSPDGKKLAFASSRDDNWDIYVVNSDGTGEERLTDDRADDTSPTWSPDGSRIVFYSSRSGDGDLYIVDVKTKKVTPLVQNPGYDGCPAWSPDGKMIVFASARDYKSGTYSKELYSLDYDSKTLTRLSKTDGNSNTDPLWSGDGKYIFFTSDRQWGVDDVWVMNADGSNPRNLTLDAREDTLSGW